MRGARWSPCVTPPARCCIRIGVIVRIGVITPILITPENMLNVSILEYCENESQTYFSIGSPSFVIYAAFKRISRWDIIRCFFDKLSPFWILAAPIWQPFWAHLVDWQPSDSSSSFSYFSVKTESVSQSKSFNPSQVTWICI